MQITRVGHTKKGRITLYLDGRYAASLHPEAFALAGFAEGDEISPEQLSQLVQQSNSRSTRERALSLLARRDYSSARLQEKLAASGDPESARRAVGRMAELGLVDDTRYACGLAADLYHLKEMAPRRIAYELRQKGLGDEAVQAALQQFDPDENEERASRLLRRRYGAVLGQEAGRRRAFAALQRLGYSGEEARRAMALARQQLEEDGQ